MVVTTFNPEAPLWHLALLVRVFFTPVIGHLVVLHTRRTNENPGSLLLMTLGWLAYLILLGSIVFHGEILEAIMAILVGILIHLTTGLPEKPAGQIQTRRQVIAHVRVRNERRK